MEFSIRKVESQFFGSFIRGNETLLKSGGKSLTSRPAAESWEFCQALLEPDLSEQDTAFKEFLSVAKSNTSATDTVLNAQS